MTPLRRRSLLAAAALPLARPALSQRRTLSAATQLGWLRNGEFAPIMVAEANGYFEAEGIAHRIMDGGPGRNPIPLVAAGQAQFGLATSALHIVAAKVARDPVDITAIGALYQKNPSAYIRLSGPGDAAPTPKDLEGRSVGIQGGSEYLCRALCRRNGVDESRVRIVTVQANAEPLMVGRVDFFNGWVTNQTYQIEQEAAKADAPPTLRGKSWQAIRFADWGLNTYGDTIFTATRTLQENPELVRGYLKAVARGVTFLIENPAEAVNVVARFPGQIEDAAKLAWRFRLQNPLMTSADTEAHGPLWMEPALWADTSTVLREGGEIPRDVPPDSAMTSRFLPGARPA